MKLAENPFFVLGVTAEASRIEVEREARKTGLRLGRAMSGSPGARWRRAGNALEAR